MIASGPMGVNIKETPLLCTYHKIRTAFLKESWVVDRPDINTLIYVN